MRPSMLRNRSDDALPLNALALAVWWAIVGHSRSALIPSVAAFLPDAFCWKSQFAF